MQKKTGKEVRLSNILLRCSERLQSAYRAVTNWWGSLSEWNRSAIVCILCLLTVARAVQQVSISPDTYLHAAVGRYILEQRSVPDHEDLSIRDIAPALEWVTHSWLGDVLIALLLATEGSFPLSQVFLLGSFVVVILLLYKLRSLLSLQEETQYLLWICTALILPVFWRVHPISIGVPFMLWLLCVLIGWRVGMGSVWWVPLIGMIWVNMSGGTIVLYLATLVLFSIQEFILRPLVLPRSRLNRGQSTQLGIALFLSAMATLWNPIGQRSIVYILTQYALLGKAKWYSTLAGALEVSTTSIFKEAPDPKRLVIFLFLSLVLSAGIALLLVRNGRKFLEEIASVLFVLPLLGFGFFYIRWIPFSLIAVLPLAGVLFQSVTRKKAGNVIKHGILITLLGILSISILFPPFAIHTIPPRVQCDLIRELQLPPNFLVSTELVGYFSYCLYPSRQYLSAQDDLFDENDTIGIYGQLTTLRDENISSLIEEGDVRVVVASKENDYLTSYLSQRKDWSLLYMDYNGLVFVQDSAVSPAFLEEHALLTVDLSRNLGTDPASLPLAIKELTRFTTRYPESILAKGQLATLFRLNKNADRAEQILLSIPKNKWSFQIYTEMGRVKAAQGDCTQAQYYFEQALRERDETYLSKTIFDLAILHAGCTGDKVRARRYFDRYLSFPLPETERQRAIEIAREFEIRMQSYE